MSTTHLQFNKEDISKIVLMPGDPLRAKFIAETYLTEVVEINSIRNMLGYTGLYKGKRISVIGSGMGIPSMGIYSYELYKFYDVDKIIRIGTCGGYSPDLNLFDLILVDKAYSESNYGVALCNEKSKLISSSYDLTSKIEETAKNKGIKVIKGNNHTSEVFSPYILNADLKKVMKKYKCISTEMEAFSLFINAKLLKKEAACILTVSDTITKNEEVTSEEREKKLTTMIELALDTTIIS